MIYVASPYSSDDIGTTYDRYLAVVDYIGQRIKQGEVVFSPIAHSRDAAMWAGLPEDFNFWKEYNFHMLSLSEELRVLRLHGWEESKGVAGEIEFAKEKGIPITYA